MPEHHDNVDNDDGDVEALSGIELLGHVIAQHRRDGYPPGPEPSAEEWAAASGAHRRMLADVQADERSRASFDAATARIAAKLRSRSTPPTP